jgi:hypothetical protein
LRKASIRDFSGGYSANFVCWLNVSREREAASRLVRFEHGRREAVI